ncbi:MAG: hypothetical protein ACR2RV_09560 [Verrucomicrobiales bacterium]
MTESSSSPGTIERRPRGRSGSWFVWGALLVAALTYFNLFKLPDLLLWPARILLFCAIGYLAVATFRKILKSKFTPKTAIFSLVLIALLYGVLFIICHLFVKLMAARDERLAAAQSTTLTEKARRVTGKFIQGNHPALFDADVGWVPRPSYQWQSHSISEQGLRGKRIYPQAPADPDARILCMGDSFTFGYEVEDDQTFPHHGEQLRPGTEWINLGICGAGLTQALKRYRKHGKDFGGKYVVIGYMNNNVKRTVNSYRGFVSPSDTNAFAKPYAKISDGELSIEPNPYQELSDYQRLLDNEEEEVRGLYELDYLVWSKQRYSKNPVVRTLGYVWERLDGYRNLDILLNRSKDDRHGPFRPGANPYGASIWHPESLGFQANAGVFDLFYNEVIADGREPIIVIFPSAGDVEHRMAGRPDKNIALTEHFDEKGYRYINLLDSLQAFHGDELSTETVFVRTHLNGGANKLLAEEIIKAFKL